jgi:hypothetical protein
VALLEGTLECSEELRILRGPGHGDLHIRNVLVSVDPGVRVHEFILVDLSQFSPETPISQDPMTLLLSIAACWLPGLAANSAIRSNLAELIVAPYAHSLSAPTLGFVQVARRIHDAVAAWALSRGFADRLMRQSLVVLAAAALRESAKRHISTADRWWFFEVGALSIRQLLERNTRTTSHPTTPPTVRSLPASPRRPSGDPRQAVYRDDLQYYPSTVKVRFCRGLGVAWREVADILQIPLYEQERFRSGSEARGIWEWLEVRGRLGELPAALLSAERPDLMKLLDLSDWAAQSSRLP